MSAPATKARTQAWQRRYRLRKLRPEVYYCRAGHGLFDALMRRGRLGS